MSGTETAGLTGLETRFDSERGRAAGLASVEARKRRNDPPEAQIEAELGRLVAELLDAALGRRAFGDLKPADRLKALQTALAYGLGRPGARQAPDEAPETPSAASLFGTPPAKNDPSFITGG